MQLEWCRTAPAWRKLQVMVQLNQAARSLAWQGLCRRHPNATSDELRRLWAEMLLGAELAARVDEAYHQRGESDADK
ncbi:MAG: hypothetical protein U0822_18930 [Anaerolineae bacterium]